MLLKLKSKSAPTLSILLMKQRRGTLYLVGLPPDGFGLGLDAFLAVEDGDRAVEHAQGAFDLDGEIDVAGRVDQVDRVRSRRCGPTGRWWRRT